MTEELPELCGKCVKPSLLHPDRRCRFCMETALEEEVFCYLNRCCQNAATFQCHAFQPALKLVGPSRSKEHVTSPRPKGPSREEMVSGFLQSDYIKYKKALALQHLKEDPDEVFMDIKYHFAWNVTQRRPVFDQADDVFDFAHEAFLSCSEAVRGFVSPLWLAPNHVHLYIVSDGELSVEVMARNIKTSSRKAFREKYPGLFEKFGKGFEVWDEAYFSETIG